VERFAYVCTHSTVARREAVALVKQASDLSHTLLVIDEGHHSTDDEQANQLSRLREAWLAAGGAVLLVTATPYRTDGTPVIDDSWFRVQRSIADQCAEGFAPAQLECRHRPVTAKAKTRKEAGITGHRAAIAHELRNLYRDRAIRLVERGVYVSATTRGQQ
jgi:superfamily II DNA or RNA helicase